MKRKPNRRDQPERRRALAEINLIGQRSQSQKAIRKGGCAQIFGVFSILTLAAAWLVISFGLH
jgi:hypothetical protein